MGRIIPKERMRIGIFGGTFDPPHLGHLILAAECRAQLDLDQLLFVLTPDPPHKQHRTITPVKDRLAMLEAALETDPTFILSTIEIDRPGPHYAIDTVNLLRKDFPDAELIYLMGSDSLSELSTWHNPPALIAALDAIGVMRRPYTMLDLPSLERAYPGLTAKVRYVDAPLLEIASRQLRARIQEGRPYRYYLPPQVAKVIQDKKLYLE